MEDTLVDMLSATEPADLSELVRQLRREVLELRQEVAELQRESTELRQQVGYWKAMHARAVWVFLGKDTVVFRRPEG